MVVAHHSSNSNFLIFLMILKINKNFFLILLMILLTWWFSIKESLTFFLYAFIVKSIPYLISRYWFFLLLKMTSPTYKYRLPKMTPCMFNGTIFSTTSSTKFWLMANLNLHFLSTLNSMSSITNQGGMATKDYDSPGQASQPIGQM